MELENIARTINFYSYKSLNLQKVEGVLDLIDFRFQMSGYYKFNFVIYNYKKEGCYLTYYEGVDEDDQAMINFGAKAKFSALTYPSSDKKDFLFQVEVINKLSQSFTGKIYDPKRKKVIAASDVKFLY